MSLKAYDHGVLDHTLIDMIISVEIHDILVSQVLFDVNLHLETLLPGIPLIGLVLVNTYSLVS
jgi:hypothetical protein